MEISLDESVFLCRRDFSTPVVKGEAICCQKDYTSCDGRLALKTWVKHTGIMVWVFVDTGNPIFFVNA